MSTKVKLLCLLLVLVVAVSGLAIVTATTVYGVGFTAAFDGLNVVGVGLNGAAATIAGGCAGGSCCTAG